MQRMRDEQARGVEAWAGSSATCCEQMPSSYIFLFSLFPPSNKFNTSVRLGFGSPSSAWRGLRQTRRVEEDASDTVEGFMVVVLLFPFFLFLFKGGSGGLVACRLGPCQSGDSTSKWNRGSAGPRWGVWVAPLSWQPAPREPWLCTGTRNTEGSRKRSSWLAD